jgi:hypothetical protein
MRLLIVLLLLLLLVLVGAKGTRVVRH